MRIQIHARAFIDGGWLELIPTNSHATLRDDRYLVTHNHFMQFDADYPVVIDEIKLFTAYGDEIPGNWKSLDIIHFDNAPQTLMLDFGQHGVLGVVAEAVGLHSAEFSAATPPLGSEVGQVDWNGIYAHVDWTTIEGIGSNPTAFDLNSPARPGSSGGGVFWNGTHIANNWSTGGHQSWAAGNPLQVATE